MAKADQGDLLERQVSEGLGEQEMGPAQEEIGDQLGELVHRDQTAIRDKMDRRGLLHWYLSPILFSICWGSLRMMALTKLARCCALCVIAIAPAIAQKQPPDATSAAPPLRRVALIIGNQDYGKPQDEVTTAHQDIQDIAASLKQAGFTTIRVVPDVKTKDEILMWTQELVNDAGSDPAIILFYFTGHGFQSGDWPFLVPTAATNNNLYDQSLALNVVIDKISEHRSAGLAIFVIDACRNVVPEPSSPVQPFTWIRSSAKPTSPVAVMDFSTEYDSPSAISAPHVGNNSPYAFEFKAVLSSNESLSDVLGLVGSRVYQDTLQRQTPVLITVPNLGRAYLVPSQEERVKERQVWTSQLQTGAARCITEFMQTYPGSSYVTAALAWINSHKGQDASQPMNCPGN